jgi:hypothetical protein
LTVMTVGSSAKVGLILAASVKKQNARSGNGLEMGLWVGTRSINSCGEPETESELPAERFLFHALFDRDICECPTIVASMTSNTP